MTVDPIKVFDSLDKSKSPIKKLRQAQREVLEKYTQGELPTSRLGVKLPTGAGKSLIAILTLEAWRREGAPVAILAASIGLAQDLQAKCDELDIPAVTIFGQGQDQSQSYRQRRTRSLTKYKRHDAIGIFNYQSYLYSTEYRQETVPPKVMVIDDANEFELVRNDFYTVEIDRDDFPDVYNDVLENLRPYFRVYPNLESFLSKNAKPGAVEVIHFTHAEKVVDKIRSNLPILGADTTFRLSYERNKDRLRSFVTFITGDTIQLRPLVVPEGVLKLSGISQIIFMGATLYERELLQKSLGIYKTPVRIIAEEQLTAKAQKEMDDFGKRLILPIDTTSLVSAPGQLPFETIASLTSMHGKMLVLANSKQVSRAIQSYTRAAGIETLYYRGYDDAERFKAMKSGVLVCANRYIGLDFPGPSVRACCIVTLPIYLEPADAFYDQVLFDAKLIQYKIANRLTQAFGRCNRLETDEAVYYILDSRILARFTGEEQFLSFFSRRLHAELYTGLFLSEDGTPAVAFEYAKSSFFGKHDKNFDDFLQDEKRWTPPIVSWSEVGTTDEIQAWEKSLQESYETSAGLFEQVGAKLKPNNQLQCAWFHYLAAMNYYHAYRAYGSEEAKRKCEDALRTAIQEGGESSWFNRLREIFNELVSDASKELKVDTPTIEARRIKEEITSDYSDFINRNDSRKKTWQAAFADLRNDVKSGTHGQVLASLETMLRMMGYKPRRGDKDKGEPDLIAISAYTLDKYQLSIEVKTKEEGETERKESVSQALTDAKVMEKRAGGAYETIPLLITQKEKVSPEAATSAQKEVTIIQTEVLDLLLGKLYERLERWSELRSPHQQQAFIDSIISPHELYSLLVREEEPVVTSEKVNSTIPNLS